MQIIPWSFIQHFFAPRCCSERRGIKNTRTHIRSLNSFIEKMGNHLIGWLKHNSCGHNKNRRYEQQFAQKIYETK